jgi:hypothetical protein
MSFVLAANNTSFVISKNGKAHAWGETPQAKHKASKKVTDIVVSIMPESPWEDVKFKRIVARGRRFAMITFEDELFSFGRK